MKPVNKYRCPQCERVTERHSISDEIKSYCELTGVTVYLQRITDNIETERIGQRHIDDDPTDSIAKVSWQPPSKR